MMSYAQVIYFLAGGAFDKTHLLGKDYHVSSYAPLTDLVFGLWHDDIMVRDILCCSFIVSYLVFSVESLSGFSSFH